MFVVVIRRCWATKVIGEMWNRAPMESSHTALINDVRAWLALDEEIKELQAVIRIKRKKRNGISEGLVSLMKTNEIDCFDIQGGKLLYTKRTTKKALSKKHLMRSLQEYYSTDPSKASEIGVFVLNSREVVTRETIRKKTVGA